MLNGARRAHAFSSASARAHLRLPSADAAPGHAHVRLAQHLKLHGRADEAKVHFAEASRLHPDSWNIFRQSATKVAGGAAAGPDFWARVDALGDRPYHLPIDLEGIDRR